MTPEKAVEIQWRLGADVAMALDHVVQGDSDRGVAAEALKRTMRWLHRCKTRHDELAAGSPQQQTLWPIIQGGAHLDLRANAAAEVTSGADWTGVAIGGLAVGETKPVMYSVLDSLEPSLPTHIPRYLMGVGFPEDLLLSVARGVDLFDCVAPTRNGRNGQAYTADGPINIRNAAFKRDSAPLENSCDCETCGTYSRGYLRHLFVAQELLPLKLLSLHNVRFLVRLGEEARDMIIAGRFTNWSRDWITRYKGRGGR